MKTSLLRLAAVVGLSIGTVAIPTAAFAAGAAVDPSIYRSSGDVAQLSFYIPDPINPCIETSGFVYGGNFTNSGSGSPITSEPFGGVWVATVDNCASTLLSIAAYKGPLPAGAFRIDKNLTAASLVATLSGSDQNGNQVPIDVNVMWTGIGSLSSSKQSFHYRAPGLNVVSRSAGDFRAATTSGSIGVASDNLIVSGQGSLESDRSFQIYVCHSTATFCK
jgi:hypothetical protein